ncbi:unnamed protein product [Cuscuta epithymum]|uniref:Uncharacterized protein n=1 Tax=Cuscuta epithymum TaxID=186058 RepID=A0AAV0FWF4_9ASTE|nr:unnamed protein product [Cuscuta epithymum]
MENGPEKSESKGTTISNTPKDCNFKPSTSSDMNSQATAYAKLAEITLSKPKYENCEALLKVQVYCLIIQVVRDVGHSAYELKWLAVIRLQNEIRSCKTF